jgi:hypothetical protein
LRLDLWLRLHEAGRAGETRRVPFLLTHRREDAEAAPSSAVEEVARAHFARIGAQARIDARPDLPLFVAPRLAGARDRSVAVIVPSALRGAHVRRCLRASAPITPGWSWCWSSRKSLNLTHRSARQLPPSTIMPAFAS